MISNQLLKLTCLFDFIYMNKKKKMIIRQFIRYAFLTTFELIKK
jgi:hypothetical protein